MKLIIISNPTRTSGTFYEAFTSARDYWHTIHVSSEEAADFARHAATAALHGQRRTLVEAIDADGILRRLRLSARRGWHHRL